MGGGGGRGGRRDGAAAGGSQGRPAHGPGPGSGGEIPADCVAAATRDGSDREADRTILGDRHEMGQRYSDCRLPATAPRPVGFDGWDAMVSAFQIVPVGRRTGRQPRGAGYDRVGFEPHRLPHSAVVHAGCHVPPAPLARQVWAGPAVHTAAVAFALVGDQGHGPGVAGGDDDPVPRAEGDGVHRERTHPVEQPRPVRPPSTAARAVQWAGGRRRTSRASSTAGGVPPTSRGGCERAGRPGTPVPSAPCRTRHTRTRPSKLPLPPVFGDCASPAEQNPAGFGTTRRCLFRLTSPS